MDVSPHFTYAHYLILDLYRIMLHCIASHKLSTGSLLITQILNEQLQGVCKNQAHSRLLIIGLLCRYNLKRSLFFFLPYLLLRLWQELNIDEDQNLQDTMQDVL